MGKNKNIIDEVFNMDDNKKLICAAAGALGALVAVSATVFAIKQHKKKQNAMLLEELDLCLDGDDIAELANEAEETKAEEPTESAPVAEEKVEEEAEEKTEETVTEKTAESTEKPVQCENTEE